MQYTKTKNKRNPWPLMTATAVIIVVIAGIVWWRLTYQQSPKTPSNTGGSNSNQNVPGGSQNGGNTTTGSGASKDDDSNTPGSSLDPSVKPMAPTGQFVSNHSPNLSGSPAPNTETSTCTTTPGAYCKIQFTSGTLIKSLPLQRTDANGDVVWTGWSLSSVGLTEGTWTVTALAVNGSNSVSTQDATNLTVKP